MRVSPELRAHSKCRDSLCRSLTLAEVGAGMLPQAVRENFVAESRSPDECAAAFCDPSFRLVTIEVSRNAPGQGVCSISNLPEE